MLRFSAVKFEQAAKNEIQRRETLQRRAARVFNFKVKNSRRG